MNKNLKIFVVIFLASLPLWWGVNFLQNRLEDFLYAQIGKPYEEIVFVKIPERPKLEIEAKSAISIMVSQAGRQKFMFAEKPDEILPIASLTKLMTVLIVLENPGAYDFSRQVTISPEAASQVDVPVYGNLLAGQTKTVENLLNLILIYSSNDAAWALAEIIGLENFVGKMNQKAKELGLENTYFVNPAGLDESPDQFNLSTARELVNLAKYISENHPLIFEISLKKGPYLVENSISSLILPENLKLLGGKTGYTLQANGCFLLVLQNERGVIFYNVVLGTPREARSEEMQKLIEIM